MELSREDSFRLNVLLANRPQAIRIDESRMIVYGLSEKGEAKVPLNPNGRPETYLRAVKELISGHVLGSPGGYPVYLRRWTRMGQMRDESLEQLLMLGEPEAVVAAVGSPGLNDELARRAWWAMEDAGNARRMLENPAIVAGSIGPTLAAYLIDYLPFETEHEQMMASVRLVLQPGLIDAEQRLDLWQKSSRKQAYLVGFLQAIPDDLPQQVSARADAEDLEAALPSAVADHNPCARLLLRIAGAPGQTFLKTVAAVLAKPPTQEVITATFDLLRHYFADLRPDGDPDLTLDTLIADADAYVADATAPAAVRDCCRLLPGAASQLAAMRLLSGLGYGVIRPLLPDPTTLGSLMRRKLAPVHDILQDRIKLLQSTVEA
jgi:hypothetical protein